MTLPPCGCPPRWAEVAREGHGWLWAPSCSHQTSPTQLGREKPSTRRGAGLPRPRLPDPRPQPRVARERPSTAPSSGRRGKRTRRSGLVQNLRLQQRTK